jgi:hypothetical protein
MVLEQFTVPGFPSLEPIPADLLMCMFQCKRLSVSVTESELRLKLYGPTHDIVVFVYLYNAPLPPIYVNREHMINSSNLLWSTHWTLWVRARSSCAELPGCETAALRVTPLTTFPVSKTTLRFNTLLLLFGAISLAASSTSKLPNRIDLVRYVYFPPEHRHDEATRVEFSLLSVLTQLISHWSSYLTAILSRYSLCGLILPWVSCPLYDWMQKGVNWLPWPAGVTGILNGRGSF